MNADLWLRFGELVLTIVIIAATGIWRLSRTETSIQKSVSRNHEQVNHDISTLRLEMVREHDEAMRAFGDSLGAIRQKITEVEIWSRDEFVRRSDFTQIIKSIQEGIVNLGEKLDARMLRMEEKLDSLRTHT